MTLHLLTPLLNQFLCKLQIYIPILYFKYFRIFFIFSMMPLCSQCFRWMDIIVNELWIFISSLVSVTKFQKSRIRETLNFLTNAYCSTDTMGGGSHFLEGRVQTKKLSSGRSNLLTYFLIFFHKHEKIL